MCDRLSSVENFSKKKNFQKLYHEKHDAKFTRKVWRTKPVEFHCFPQNEKMKGKIFKKAKCYRTLRKLANNFSNLSELQISIFHIFDGKQ